MGAAHRTPVSSHLNRNASIGDAVLVRLTVGRPEVEWLSCEPTCLGDLGPELGRAVLRWVYGGFSGPTASPRNGVVNSFFDRLFLIAPSTWPTCSCTRRCSRPAHSRTSRPRTLHAARARTHVCASLDRSVDSPIPIPGADRVRGWALGALGARPYPVSLFLFFCAGYRPLLGEFCVVALLLPLAPFPVKGF